MAIHSRPLVSVVTPVYNGEAYLDACIQSVLAQNYDNFEYIILNNCSKDRTLEIAQKYAARDGRIRVYSNEAVLPIMKNWNTALGYMSDDSHFCKVVHADDMLLPNCLDQMVSVAVAHPAVGMVGSYGLWGTKVVSDGLPYAENVFPGKQIARLTLLDKLYCFWSPSALLIRSDLIRKQHQFYPETHIHADIMACYEVLRDSDFGFVHQVLTFIRRHDDSMTAKVADEYNKFILTNLDLFCRYGPEFLLQGEYGDHYRKKLRHYYHYLAKSIFQRKNRQFWKFHFDGFKEIGHRIKPAMLMRATLSELISRPTTHLTTLLKSTSIR